MLVIIIIIIIIIGKVFFNAKHTASRFQVSALSGGI